MAYMDWKWNGVLESHGLKPPWKSSTFGNHQYHFSFSVKGAKAPFLLATLEFTHNYVIDDFDFENVTIGEVEEGSLLGVKPVFLVQNWEDDRSWSWCPIDHHEFWELEQRYDPDNYKPEVTILVRAMNMAEYDTLYHFDRAGPPEDWIDVEFAIWSEPD